MVTITTVGKAGSAKRLNGTDSIAPFDYIAVGSGSTAESVDDTTLASEHTTDGFARKQATCSVVSNAARWEVEFTNTGSGSVNIREVGILNASSGGLLFLRHVYDVDEIVPVGDTIRIVITDIQNQGS